MDVSAVRAEIKAWERDFKAKHSREPTVQEIKAQPAIAAKYKLYKALSKAAASGSQHTHSSRPTTPPRSLPRQPPTSPALHRSRAVKVDPPVSTSNPFSPVKSRKTLSDHIPSSQRASNTSRPNPFTTPSKKRPTPGRSLSPDPFPPIQPLLLVQPPPPSYAAPSAVTRARKRLRGEPVSPSPVKEKRARVSSQAAIPFPSRNALLPSPDDSDGDDAAAYANDSIVFDSPVKPSAGGRNFKVLFDDVRGETRPVKALVPKKAGSGGGIFAGLKKPAKSRAMTPSSDEDGSQGMRKPLDAPNLSAGRPTKGRKVNGKPSVPTALVPSKNDLWSDIGPSKGPVPKQAPTTLSQSQSGPSSLRTSNKRALSDDPEEGNGEPPGKSHGNSELRLALLPPSPPPADVSKSSSAKFADKGKGKAMAAFSRKKAKLLEGAGVPDHEDDTDSDDMHVKEIDLTSRTRRALPLGDLPDSDWDPYWGLAHRANDDADSAPFDPGRFDVDLPDELQRVLAISPDKANRENHEERIVRGLLYGSRETQYDPSKGGEIWDVGEDVDSAGETEEDWESEPVPWEVGEL